LIPFSFFFRFTRPDATGCVGLFLGYGDAGIGVASLCQALFFFLFSSGAVVRITGNLSSSSRLLEAGDAYFFFPLPRSGRQLHLVRSQPSGPRIISVLPLPSPVFSPGAPTLLFSILRDGQVIPLPTPSRKWERSHRSSPVLSLYPFFPSSLSAHL